VLTGALLVLAAAFNLASNYKAPRSVVGLIGFLLLIYGVWLYRAEQRRRNAPYDCAAI